MLYHVRISVHTENSIMNLNVHYMRGSELAHVYELIGNISASNFNPLNEYEYQTMTDAPELEPVAAQIVNETLERYSTQDTDTSFDMYVDSETDLSTPLQEAPESVYFVIKNKKDGTKPTYTHFDSRRAALDFMALAAKDAGYHFAFRLSEFVQSPCFQKSFNKLEISFVSIPADTMHESLEI